MKIPCFVALTFLLTSVAFPQGESLAFKDVPLGMSLAEFTTKFQKAPYDGACKAPHLDFGTVFAVGTNQVLATVDRRSTGVILATKRFPWESTHKGRWATNDTIAGIEAFVAYYFNAENSAEWDSVAFPYLEQAQGKAYQNGHERCWNEWSPEGKASSESILLGKIQVEFRSEQFETVLGALEAKYGKHHRRTSEKFLDAMGHDSTAQNWIWDVSGAGYIIATQRVASHLDWSSVTFINPKVADRSKLFRKEVPRGNALDL